MRPLRKAWRWVGAFGPDAMLCAARARVGPARRAWWAVWDGQRLWEGSRGVEIGPRTLRVRDGAARIELAWDAGIPVEVTSLHGGREIWTRKTPLVVRGVAAPAGRELAVDCTGLLDESAGRHARVTRWRWSAGAGASERGARVSWNLVHGLHDGRERSERTVWVDGVPHPVAPVEFGAPAGVAAPDRAAGDLSAVTSRDGVELVFTAVATRARRERLPLVSSSYVQPFGTFAGSLPVAGRLRAGWGVMERHEARW